MSYLKLKVAIFGVLGLASTQSMAALCTLAAAPTGSAYINAYNQGRTVPPLAGPAVSSLASRMNFGADLLYGGSAGDCEISGIVNDATPPEAGYALVASTNRVLPTVTGGATQIGTVYDRVWRDTATNTSCYFGTRVGNLINVDHDSGTAGIQNFLLKDVARGGFSGSGSVGVGYFLVPSSNGTPTYRIGRTFTSVPHFAYGTATQAERQNNAIGHLDLPVIGGSSTANTNGSQQQAAVNNNWVDFTAYAIYLTPNGGNATSTSMMYVKSSCDSTSPSTWVKTGAIRVRQTGLGGSFKEIETSGYAPPGAVIP